MSKNSKKKLLDSLSEKHKAYVLITCDHPDSFGNMEIEFHYQGDKDLASFMIQGAQNVVDQEDSNTISHEA